MVASFECLLDILQLQQQLVADQQLVNSRQQEQREEAVAGGPMSGGAGGARSGGVLLGIARDLLGVGEALARPALKQYRPKVPV